MNQTNKLFKRTDKQKEQTKLLAGPAKHVMSYGGSRSGKTFGICRALIIRACKTKSRHLVTRLKFNHAKTSLWHETFPKVMELCFPDLIVHPNKADFFYQFENGSEIWIGGLDEKERVEKILGKEYSTIFFNECSQIPYTSISIALTRLAEQNSLTKKAYYDENPPTKKHWSYPLFVKGVDPDTWEIKKDAGNYQSILMNPEDNIENIDEDYIPGILDQMSEKDKKRFRDGLFTDESNGNIYYAFDRETHCSNEVTYRKEYPIYFGMDFNVNPMTAVVCQTYNDTVHVIDEIWLENSNTPEMAKEIIRRYGPGFTVIPDSTGKKRTTNATSVATDHQLLRDAGFNVPHVLNPYRMDRYNNVNNLFEKRRIFINNKCVKLIRDLEQVSFEEGSNLPNTSEKHLTHISDAFGYLISWQFPIIVPKGNVHFLPR